MEDGKGWKPEYNQWWSEFLTAKKVKGISKDTWSMVCSCMSLFRKAREADWVAGELSRSRSDWLDRVRCDSSLTL